MNMSKLFIISFLFILIAYLLNTNCFHDFFLPQFPEVESDKIWNPDNANHSESIRSIEIKVPINILNLLKEKLLKTSLPKSMPDSNFTYGFNENHLRIILDYWMKSYLWYDWEAKINSFPHFFTDINGLQIHFIHIKPKLKEGQKSVPILLLHGWPGSFFEFYKVIPMLIDTPETEKIAYEIICPSLVGFGWSDSPKKPGFGITAISNIMFNLLKRLNLTERFYVQGGDFGSLIASSMAKLYPRNVAGIHVNLIETPINDFRYWLKIGLGAILPKSLHFLNEEDQNLVYPYEKKIMEFLNQMGYMWMQNKRSNTMGIALSDSPAGLAAYIIEKFGAWSNDLDHYLKSDSGSLEDIPITKDEMITNVMVYYITNTISSSFGLYREMWNEEDQIIFKHPVKVPAGLALFPKELVKTPLQFAKLIYRDIRQFTIMPRGGHFAALEEPALLVEDLKSFVNLLEHTT